MPETASLQPVRRSPLEHVHAALGATWRDGAARWPETYGDEASEATAVAQTAGLADIGPIDKLVVRGRETRAALSSLGVSAAPRSIVGGRDAMQAWCLAEDEALLLLPRSLDSAAGNPATRIAEDLRGVGAAVTDQSSGTSVFRIVGPASPAVLEEACAVDVSPRVMKHGGIAQLGMAGVRITLARQDHADTPGYTLLMARDEAEYLWASLHMLGAPHGLVAIGSKVAGGLPPAAAGEAS